VHERRIDGEVHTFVNEGALFMNAMTWWDRETESVWSQPLGASIKGELLGTRLTLLPFELVPWQTWLEAHPDTTVLVDERGDLRYSSQFEIDRFVIGVSIGDAATGFYFGSSANQGVVNEVVGDFPVVVFADGSSREINVFLRSPRQGLSGPEVLPGVLTFEIVKHNETPEADGLPVVRKVRDIETGSTWDIEAGVATDGPLKGTLLQRAHLFRPSTGRGKTSTRTPCSGATSPMKWTGAGQVGPGSTDRSECVPG
jgi:hypothetical protein